MAIILNDNLQINAGKPVDSKYLSSTNVPYTSVSAANTAIPQSYRYIGLKVNINNVEYWYYNGTADVNLVALETPESVSGLTAAANGLTVLGDNKTVVLGGTLTGNTTINVDAFDLKFSGDSVQYTADYSGTYTPRSLVDKGYTTGLTSGLQSQINYVSGVTSANTTSINTINGQITYLSGQTSANTTSINTINSQITYISGVTSGNTVNIGINAGNIADLQEDIVYLSGVTSGNTQNIAILASLSGITNQSITAVTNGLTKTGNHTAKLGGTLSENTTINVSTFDLKFSGDSVQYGADYSGTYVPRSLVDQGYVTGLTSGIQTDITNIENDITYLSGQTSANTVSINTINGQITYLSGQTSANTTSINTINGQITYLSGQTSGNTQAINNLAGISITAVTNGLTKVGGNSAKLGGTPLSENTTIGLGGFGMVIGSGSSIANYVNVNNLAITTSPSTGLFSDGVLVWNSGDKLVKQVSASVIGGVTGATNGLSVNSAKQVVLGGNLTGDTTVSTNSFGLVLGSGGTASGDNSLVLVGGQAIGNCSIGAIGGVACGEKSWAIGVGSVATGLSAVAFGSSCALGNNSLAAGGNSKAFANASTVIGGNSKTCGFGSFALGSFNIAYGTGAFALGVNAHAHGAYSFAFGKGIAGGKEIQASGLSSINFSTNTSAQIDDHGADADYSVILGGINHQICINNCGASIIGSCGTTGIVLTGSSYQDHVAVANLAIWSTPANSTCTDILVYDNVTKKVAKNTIGNLGAITGATNGLQKLTSDVGLGGILTQSNTVVSGNSNCLSLGSAGSRIEIASIYNNCSLIDASTLTYIRSTGTGGDIVIDSQNQGQVVIKSQNGAVLGNTFTNAVGFDLDYSNNLFKIIDNRVGSNQTGIQYQSDYSGNYVDRSLVDKAYVDSVAAGLDAKDAANLATTVANGNIDLTGGTFVSGSTIDGVVVQNGWRVLIKNQTNSVQNGIYIYSASTSGFTRAEDFDGTPSGEVSNGAFLNIITGSTLINTQWIVTTPDPITVNVTPIDFTLLSQQLDIVAGTGITITTSGAQRLISTKLGGAGCALGYDGGLGLCVTPSIAGSGLTMSTGIIDVCASASALIGTEIPVKFGTSNNLVVDAACFSYLNASNGLTKSGDYITLGGNLTGDTTINGTGTFYDLNLASLGTFNVTMNQQGSTIRDNSSGGGIKYFTDYSGDFTARSLVDQGYVTGLTNTLATTKVACSDYNTYTGATRTELDLTLTGATNGLTKVGRDVVLGGSLTGNTCVNTNNYGVALGNNNTTFGTNSIVLGVNSVVSGNSSISIGGCAYSSNSIAIGGVTYAPGSIAIGGNACATSSISLFGNTCASGSIAIMGTTRGISSIAASYCGIISSDFAASLGGRDHIIQSGNTSSAIIGGSGITLTANNYPNFVAVPNLAIFSTPTDGTFSDGILVWDTLDKKVKKSCFYCNRWCNWRK
jgi:trimeric autotransporter adhesin